MGPFEMEALDTNVIVRLLVCDDEKQAETARSLLEAAELDGTRYLVTNLVLLELIWVLSAVYGLGRDEILDAFEMLAELPVLELENHDLAIDLIRIARDSRAHLPDLFIGLVGKARGATTTLTFEKGLQGTGLFRRL